MINNKTEFLSIKNARIHNLKNLDVAIPLHKVTLVSGVSGSGKSSLVFDLLANWCKTRFIEAFTGEPLDDTSLELMLAKGADNIDPLIPPITLSGYMASTNPRSNLSTITGLKQLLIRLIDAAGHPACPFCKGSISIDTIDSIVNTILSKCKDCKTIIACKIAEVHSPTHLRQILTKFTAQGYIRFIINDKMILVDDLENLSLKEAPPYTLNLVVDRLKPTPSKVQRVYDSIKTALNVTSNKCIYCKYNKNGQWQEINFSTIPFCTKCEKVIKVELNKTLKGYSLEELSELKISEIHSFLNSLDEINPSANYLLSIIQKQLQTIIDLKLEYLRVNSTLPTMSQGELLKIRLSSILNRRLSGILYIFDEVISLLPQKERKFICNIIKELATQGNTCVIVENCNEAIEIADFFLILGPGADKNGGQIQYAGKSKERLNQLLIENPQKEPTGPCDDAQLVKNKSFLEIEIKNHFYLSQTQIKIQKYATNIIVGPTGSGKSLLLNHIYNFLNGDSDLNSSHKILIVEQSPVYGNIYSVVCSFLGIFSNIRRLLGTAKIAQAYGITPEFFSLSKRGGRCEACKGTGVSNWNEKIFEFESPCPICKGKRYDTSVLNVTFRGKNIYEILNMTCSEAADFFSAHKAILSTLNLAERIGLGHLKLGRPIKTLSAGERQRLKLARFLSKTRNKKGIILLDNPAKGLHFSDLSYITTLFYELTSKGHTIIFAENNEILARCAQWEIVLGPGGGPNGGRVLRQDFIKKN